MKLGQKRGRVAKIAVDEICLYKIYIKWDITFVVHTYTNNMEWYCLYIHTYIYLYICG